MVERDCAEKKKKPRGNTEKVYEEKRRRDIARAVPAILNRRNNNFPVHFTNT